MAHKQQQSLITDKARKVALTALHNILVKGTGLNEALADAQSRLNDSRDRAFQRQLVMTTLRHLGEINGVLDQYLSRKPKGRARLVVTVLQLGIAQVLFLNVSAYAAASTTVSLVRKAGFSGHAKMVNAIMRRVAENGPAMIEALDAVRLNTPDWLWQSLESMYGPDIARDVSIAHTAEPALDISVKSDPDSWARRLDAIVLPTGSLRLGNTGIVRELDGFEDGEWWIQDVAAALPARLLGAVKGSRILDLCAAPGGKSAQLASRGARITALDQSEKRLKRLQKNMARLSLNVETVMADATTWQPDTPYDGVLLDAPCSATGTIRRHPDILWNKSLADVRRMASLQQSLLKSATTMVEPGGYLVYCTCSLHHEEGEDQIARLLDGDGTLELSPISTDEIPGLPPEAVKDGMLRTLPCYWADLGGMDGFFAARLKRLI